MNVQCEGAIAQAFSAGRAAVVIRNAGSDDQGECAGFRFATWSVTELRFRVYWKLAVMAIAFHSQMFTILPSVSCLHGELCHCSFVV